VGEKTRRLRIGANNEVVREVLARALRVPGGHRAYWSLTYMPDSGYMLAIGGVDAEITTPEGQTYLQRLSWPKQ
jgi:hypothetical protein